MAGEGLGVGVCLCLMLMGQKNTKKRFFCLQKGKVIFPKSRLFTKNEKVVPEQWLKRSLTLERRGRKRGRKREEMGKEGETEEARGKGGGSEIERGREEEEGGGELGREGGRQEGRGPLYRQNFLTFRPVLLWLNQLGGELVSYIN